MGNARRLFAIGLCVGLWAAFSGVSPADQEPELILNGPESFEGKLESNGLPPEWAGGGDCKVVSEDGKKVLRITKTDASNTVRTPYLDFKGDTEYVLRFRARNPETVLQVGISDVSGVEFLQWNWIGGLYAKTPWTLLFRASGAWADAEVRFKTGIGKGAIHFINNWGASVYVDDISLKKARKALVEEEGLLAYYDFDEGSGTVVKDKSKYANDGTIRGATWVQGKVGSALKFNGTDSYVEFPKGTPLEGITALTIEMWAYRDRPGRNQDLIYEHYDRFYIGDGYGSGQYALMSNLTGKWITVVKSKEGAPMNAWTHVAFTWDLEAGVAKVFYNGAERGSETGMKGKAVAGDSLSVGITRMTAAGKPPEVWRPFSGMIDEIRIYSRALSQAEIRVRVRGY